jgi:hypothetical protein
MRALNGSVTKVSNGKI